MHDLGRRVKVAVIAVSAAALIGGCAGADDEPATLPDTAPSATESVDASPTPEATTSPSPTPTADPTATLEAEAVAFYLRYEDVSEESWVSEDALGLRREMFADSCTTCLAGYENARRVHEDGLTFVGDPLPESVVSVSSVAGKTLSLLVESSVPAGRLENGDGDVVEQFDASPNVQIVVQVQKIDGDWMILKEEVL